MTAPVEGAARFPWRPLQALGLLVVLAGCAWLGARELSDPGAVRDELGVLAAPSLVLTQALVASVFLPAHPIALLMGLTFGFVWGAPMVLAGWLLASWIQYALIRWILHDAGRSPDTAALPPWLARLRTRSVAFLVLGRLLPYGGYAVNVLAALSAVPAWRFLWCTVVGLIPAALVFATLGSLLR